MAQHTIGILASIFDHFSLETRQVAESSRSATLLWGQIDTAVRRALRIDNIDHDLAVDPQASIHERVSLFLASTGAKSPDQTTGILRGHRINPRLEGTSAKSVFGANIEGVVCVDFVNMFPSIIMGLLATGDIRMDRDLGHFPFVLKHKEAIRAAMSGDRHAINLYLNFLFGMLPWEDKESVTAIADKVTVGLMRVTQHIVSNIDEHFFLETPGLESDIRDKVGLLGLPFETSRFASLVLISPTKHIALKDGDNRFRGVPKLSRHLRQELGGT